MTRNAEPFLIEFRVHFAEHDHFDAIVVRDGMAMFAAPGGIPVIFDHESVDQVVGDLAGRGVEV